MFLNLFNHDPLGLSASKGRLRANLSNLSKEKNIFEGKKKWREK
jgi:hypothetical protein